MKRENDLKFLDRAVAIAAAALERGVSPFSSVLVKDQKILVEATNQTTAEDNPTSHAEMVAIREACRTHGSRSLAGGTIYCSCEPCPMCLSAMFYTGITRVVFAATLEDAIDFGSGDPCLSARWLNEHGRMHIELLQLGGKTTREDMVALFKKCVAKYGHL